jgi:hypothetical protein
MAKAVCKGLPQSMMSILFSVLSQKNRESSSFGEYEIRTTSGLGTIDFSLAPDEA